MKLTFKQFFMIPVGIAILAFFLMLVELTFVKGIETKYFVIWVAFQAWAMYFMAGCTYSGGLKVLLGYVGGATASIIIIKAGTAVGGALGMMAMPLSVLIFVVPIICFERVPWFDFIPAWFVGAGAYFSLIGSGNFTFTEAAIADVFSCAVGLCFGVVTVIGRGKYEAMLAAKAPAEEAAPAAAEAPAESEE